jgi:hypothetical protein
MSAKPRTPRQPFPAVGERAWFTKSMRLVDITEDLGEGNWTVARVDNGKTMTATTDGLLETTKYREDPDPDTIPIPEQGTQP